MAVSVIIPVRTKDEAKVLAESLNGALEVKVIDRGSVASARNEGAAMAKGDELLFLDADMRLPPDLDLSRLSKYGFDMATAHYRVDPWDLVVGLGQNVLADVGLPISYFGGFMYVRKKVFHDVGGFREMPAEDTEFAHRAWWRGWKVDVFPFEVVHTRPFHWANAIGPVFTQDGTWGWP